MYAEMPISLVLNEPSQTNKKKMLIYFAEAGFSREIMKLAKKIREEYRPSNTR